MGRQGGRSKWEGEMVEGAGGMVGCVWGGSGGLQFALNSKEELQTEEKDQWALMISLPATPRDFYLSGVGGCHGDKYSWLKKPYGET